MVRNPTSKLHRAARRCTQSVCNYFAETLCTTSQQAVADALAGNYVKLVVLKRIKDHDADYGLRLSSDMSKPVKKQNCNASSQQDRATPNKFTVHDFSQNTNTKTRARIRKPDTEFIQSGITHKRPSGPAI